MQIPSQLNYDDIVTYFDSRQITNSVGANPTIYHPVIHVFLMPCRLQKSY